jgi:hypothetical protein
MIHRTGRRIAALAGGAAVVAMAVITAGCENTANQAPSSTTTPTPTTTTSMTTPPPATTALPTAPTEKSINPTAGNLFTPRSSHRRPRPNRLGCTARSTSTTTCYDGEEHQSHWR